MLVLPLAATHGKGMPQVFLGSFVVVCLDGLATPLQQRLESRALAVRPGFRRRCPRFGFDGGGGVGELDFPFGPGAGIVVEFRQQGVAGVTSAGAMLDEHQIGVPGRLYRQVLVAEAADQQALEAALEVVALGSFRLRQSVAGRIDRMDEIEEVFHADIDPTVEDVLGGGEGAVSLASGHGRGMPYNTTA